MNISEKELVKTSRDLDEAQLKALFFAQIYKYMSWGAHKKVIYYSDDGYARAARFYVNAHHHKGHMYIRVNGSDLYDVFYTTLKGRIIDESLDLFFDQLVDVIDSRIEYIPEYKNR